MAYYDSYGSRKEVSELMGQTLVRAVASDAEIDFETTDGRLYRMHHIQDCCEGVDIESIVGDLQDLIGSPITYAEESTGETPADYVFAYEPESYTWTFYKFATAKGWVDIRWLGQSNGYYGEGVAFCLMKGADLVKGA